MSSSYHITLGDQLSEQLDAFAKAHEMKTSQIVSLALRHYFALQQASGMTTVIPPSQSKSPAPSVHQPMNGPIDPFL